jgi:hypothetical protein
LDEVAGVAQAFLPPPPCQSADSERIADLQQVGIPMGWKSRPNHPGDWLNKLGLALTAFAVSLGVPFWFDLLNRS